MSKIGYMINESSVLLDEVDVMEIKNSNRVIGKGRLQTGNEKNRNGRIYRTEDLAREINAPRQRELLSTGNFRGEIGHPIGPDASSLIRQQTIDPSKVCVQYLKLWMEGDDVMSTFQGTNNDHGEFFDKDLRAGVKPAFSLRALGTVNATPAGALVENLKMITYDYVIYPSHPHAYTQGVINESVSSIILPESSFEFNNSTDGTKSYIGTFTNEDVINAIKLQAQNESAIEYIKDKSYNYHLLKECFDMTKIDTVDIINSRQIALTEAGNATIIMNVEDYIAKEIQNYKG